MLKGRSPDHVEVLTAPVVLREIAQVNAALAEMLSQRRPAGEKLFVAHYPYGSLPVDRGVFRTPCSGPFCDGCQRLSEWIGSKWSHQASLPLQLLLSGWAEVYLEDNSGQSTPLRLLKAGDLFGAFELCDTLAGMAVAPPPWNVSSGARSVVIQANLGDRRVRRALAEILQESETMLPDPITQSWKFTQLVARKKASWQSRVFFVPADWIFAGAEGSRRLQLYVALTSWKQSAFLRFNLVDDTVELEKLNLLVPYHTARHLLLIARGEAPAFRLIKNDEIEEAQAAPFKELRQVVNGALSKAKIQHVPLFLQPHHLTNSGASGYYSLSRPTILGPRLPVPRNYADWLNAIWNGLQEIHGDRRSSLDLKSTTAHAPFETSNAGQRDREGLGLVTYLRRDLGIAPEEKKGKENQTWQPSSDFGLRNSRGAGSFFTACIRVVRA